jgi:hypothetical protein
MTTPLVPTPHAAARMAQRGIALADIELLVCIGTEVEGGFFVREKDFAVFDRELKRLRQRARRLVGKRMVLEAARVVTAYHAVRGKERRLLQDL